MAAWPRPGDMAVRLMAAGVRPSGAPAH